MKLKRTIWSALMCCIYLAATLGPALFDTCAACCTGHRHLSACCHEGCGAGRCCTHEDGGDGAPADDSFGHFGCNCLCHIHSHEPGDGAAAAVLPTCGGDGDKKICKKNISSDDTAACVAPAAAGALRPGAGVPLIFGDSFVAESGRSMSAAGLRAPPVVA